MLRIAIISILTFFVYQPVFASHVFGYHGNNGQSGRNGRQGSHGRDVTIYASEQYQSMTSIGRDGDAGENGGYGQSASSCYQPQNAENETGASGGSGGNGGDGGDGGDAGNVTVYYSDIQNIRNVRLTLASGEGGQGGRSEWGGSGCRCSRYQWVVNEVTYTCSNGSEGQKGQQGRYGRDGSNGRLSVIQNDGPLPAERASLTVSMADALAARLPMSEHQWDQRNGARQLFASGSEMPDSYKFYLETFHTDVVTNWDFERDAELFADVPLSFRLNDKSFQLGVSDKVWLETSVEQGAEQTKITVNHAVFKSEVTAFNFRGFSGANGALAGHFTDDGGAQQYLDTKVFVRYYTRGLVFRKLRWEGWVPAELLEIDGNKFKVQLGQLGIDSRYLENGDRIYVSYVVRRSTASHKIDLSYAIRHRIGG